MSADVRAPANRPISSQGLSDVRGPNGGAAPATERGQDRHYSGGVAFLVVDGLRAIEFGTPGAMRRRLVDLVVNGDKRATAGLLSEYEDEHEPLEHVGERLAIIDDDGRHVATVSVTKVEVSRFANVPDEFALAEAEGDLDAADFRASHTTYWSSTGTPPTDDTLIVQLYFDLAADEHPG
jgi:uncharacterized protein YhfF